MDWRLEEANGKATIEARREADGKGLYKAYAVGPAGRCLLGTMTPHSSGLAIKKTLAVDALRQKGCWPVRRVETSLAYSFERPSDPPAGWRTLPAPPLDDPLLCRCAQRSGGWWQQTPAGATLAYLYSPSRPFPMEPLFCFARLGRLGGKPTLFFSFDSAGRPVMPHKIPPLENTRDAT